MGLSSSTPASQQPPAPTGVADKVKGDPTWTTGILEQRQRHDAGMTVCVMSYNVLAERYSTRRMFPYTKPEFRKWKSYRKSRILDNIKSVNPDILCMQEVEVGMFNTFKAALPAYAGQRSSSGNVCGNAIFFKTSAFELVSRMVHNLYGKDVLRAINPEPEPDTEHWFGTLHHTALHLTLRVKGANSGDASKGAAAAAAATTDAAAASSATAAPPAPAVATGAGGGAGAEDGGSSGGSSNSGSSSKIRSDMLHVVCTHFYWRPQDSHMKSYQAAALTHHVGAHVAKGEHLLVCGDLNSMPKPQLELHDDNGWVLNSAYDIITKGKPVAPAGASPEALSAFGVAPVLKLRSPWPSGWQSAYASVNGAEPKFTNYTANFKATLDYIFYDPATIAAHSVAKLPDEAALAAETALPSSVFPSDHLYIAAKLKLLTQ